jgi:hypothetical protein
MLMLLSILQYQFYNKQNFLSYIFIFRKQFYTIAFGLKIIGHGNPDSNLELPCTSAVRRNGLQNCSDSVNRVTNIKILFY